MHMPRCLAILLLAACGPAQAVTTDELDALTSAVEKMCLFPTRMGDVLKVEGQVKAGLPVRIQVVEGKLSGTITYEKWQGIPITLDKYKSEPRECAVRMLELLLPTFRKEPPPRKVSTVDYQRTVDFSGLRCGPDGRKQDVVVYTDVVTFRGDVPRNYRRNFSMAAPGQVKVRDLVAGTEHVPSSRPGGEARYGSVNFKVEKATRKARPQWIYTDAHSSDNEGVGFSSAAPIEIRSVDVTYVLPPDVTLEDRHFDPPEIEAECTRRRDGFRCENLRALQSFRETWHWDAWKACP